MTQENCCAPAERCGTTQGRATVGDAKLPDEKDYKIDRAINIIQENQICQSHIIANVPNRRGGQTFPKSMEIRNPVAFRAVFFVFFRPCFSVVAESVSEQLLQRTGGLGGQFWLSKESVSTSATDCRIPTPICTKYGFQKVRTCKIDGLYR